MRIRSGLKMGAFVALLAAAPLAQAHILGAHGAGFTAGLSHPFLGLDHLLAMVVVGLWAAQLGRAAYWRVPLAFIGMMAAGAALAYSGVTLPAVETGIATSLLTLGLLIGFMTRMPVWLSSVIVGVFAVFHGHAHGTALSQAASAPLYAGGFIAATASLHGAGMALGQAASGRLAWLARVAGFAVAGSGALLLVA